MTDKAIPEEWNILLEEFQRRQQDGRSMGGPEKLAKHEARERLNARQVINAFVDKGSFMELGTLAGGMSYGDEPATPCDACVGGMATVNQRPVILVVEDFTVKGGSIGHVANTKRQRLASLAAREGVPYILFLDGAGHRATNGLSRIPYAPSDLLDMAAISGQVPTVAIVLGASAGHGALTGVMTDFLIMLENSCMFSAGPPLVAASLGENVSKEDLGGARMHATVSGVCHNLAADEEEAFDMVRRYLSFLPGNAAQKPPKIEPGEATAERQLDDILNIVPRDGQKPYNMKKVIDILVDDPLQALEFQPLYGTTMITTLARIGGTSVGIVANQPGMLAGSVTTEGALKATHFIDICDAYGLPLVFLADNPGVLPGSQAERSGALRAAARMYSVQSRARVPKLHVTFRKAFGFGSSIMAMNPFDQQTLTLAFPGISLGGIPAIGGGDAAKVDADTQQQMIEAEQSGSWTAGDTMAYDEIIDPRELRNALIKGLRLAAERPPRREGHQPIRP